MRSSLVWTVSLLLALPLVPRDAAANVTSKGFRAAGFAAAEGENDGKNFTAAEKAKVQAAIDLLKPLGVVGGQNIGKCASCLDKMLVKKRLCREGGTCKACAVTLPDKKRGCDPGDSVATRRPRTPGVWETDRGSKQGRASPLASEWYRAT